MKKYKAIGLMSGSSLDGLDIAYCEFQVDKNQFDWHLINAELYPFSEMWQLRLRDLPQQSALAFARTHTYFGHYMGQMVNDFIKKHQIEPDFIAAHGHTIFHEPNKRMTSQIGDGGALAAITKLPVINDFRTHDIAINGEGTPLAPIADALLFSEYDFCLNLGGIANITCTQSKKIIAFDITSCNQVLNFLAQTLGLEYDTDGAIAKKGTLLPKLLEKVKTVPYFQKAYPKSISNEWVRKIIIPIYMEHEASIEDRMTTACHQVATDIKKAIEQIINTENLNDSNQYKMLVTGGGAKHSFLMDCIQNYCSNIEVIIPPRNIIDYKEAILMALLGVLRIENRYNCLSSVTGAIRNTIGGAIYQGDKKYI